MGAGGAFESGPLVDHLLSVNCKNIGFRFQCHDKKRQNSDSC